MKHRLILVLAAVYVGAALPACIGADFTLGIPDGSDAGPDGDPACNPCPDSSVAPDGSGSPDSASSGDTGGGGTDSGAPDSGTPADSGSGDAGCGPCDAGADSASDSGIDSGFDSGVDSGSDSGIDSGSDAGSDSGSDSGSDGGSDGGSDAGDGGDGGDAGCVISSTICNGDQPQICDGTHTYVNNGGICNYGCSAGACNCNAGGGRLSFTYPVGVDYVVTDSVTTYSFVAGFSGSWTLKYSDAVANCPAVWNVQIGGSWGVPTGAQMNTIVSQQATDNSCSPDNDSKIAASYDVWTSDSCGVNKHLVFSLKDGTTTCDDDTNLHRTWCKK